MSDILRLTALLFSRSDTGRRKDSIFFFNNNNNNNNALYKNGALRRKWTEVVEEIRTALPAAFYVQYLTPFFVTSPPRSTCHRHSSEEHLGEHVPECISTLPGGGRPPEHDVHLAEGWRERLPRGVSVFFLFVPKWFTIALHLRAVLPWDFHHWWYLLWRLRNRYVFKG